jgi:hypothetical protein
MVDRSNNLHLLNALDAVLGGDPRAISILASVKHEDLQAATAKSRRPACLARASVVRVLRGLLEDAWTPEQAQTWASFVRRGYFAGRGKHPVRPLDVDYEEAYEQEIAASVSRLDEIGDLVDGDVSTGEVLELLQLLGEP